MTPAVIQQLTLQASGRTLLRELSLTLAEGDRVVLTGPSGCGKSSLLRCLLGFAAPASGSIHLFDTPLTPHTVWDLRRKIAYVPQEPQLGDGQVREVMARPFRFQANRSLAENLKQLPDWLTKLGLSASILDQETRNLSGGEKQRLAIAAALMLQRPLLLMDEATSALDPENRARVADLLLFLSGVTLLAVSHETESWQNARILALEPPA